MTKDNRTDAAGVTGSSINKPNNDQHTATGRLFLFGGLALMIGSFFYSPNVSTDSSMIGDTYIPGREVANIAKLNIQILICLVGAALTISGSILLAARGAELLPHPPKDSVGDGGDGSTLG